MTQEIKETIDKLKERIEYLAGYYRGCQAEENCWISLNALEALLAECVIIEKNSKRHPSADILHRWIEGEYVEFLSSNATWEDMSKYFPLPYCEIRVSAPVYEYQFTTMIDNRVFTTEFMTKEEAMQMNMILTIKEETKQERK